jgi:hypothetical protein
VIERKPFNVTLVHPEAYVHSLALKEAADYVHSTLVDLGYPSVRTTNLVTPEAYNIVFCAHLLDRATAAAIPADSIIFNSEQLEDTDGWHLRGGVYQEILSRYFVWDYSQRNAASIPHDDKCVVPFLYRRELLRSDLPRIPGPSLLFYGAITPHRRELLRALHGRGIPVELLFGQYGNERDLRMRNAWAILNLHKDAPIAFEPIRCFYPLINEVPVISEEVEDASVQAFRGAVFFFDPPSLIDGIKGLHDDPVQFHARSRIMLDHFKRQSPAADFSAAVERFFESLERRGAGP